jgi:enoyl-CoA hydratase/carnithine racemase
MSGSVLTTKSGTAAWLRLNRPEAANSINEVMRGELAAAFAAVAEDPGIRAIVITGNRKAFAAGSDVRELRALSPAGSLALSERIAAFHKRIAHAGKPVIAAISGWCLGGGFELALACDMRIASRSAKFGLPEPTLGLVAGGGGIPRLASLVGPGLARHMCLTAEIVDAAAAFERGIVSALHDDDQLEQEALRLTERIASLAPFAVSQIKRVLGGEGASSLADAIKLEAQACALCMGTKDFQEGTAAFLEKRSPEFNGQ